MNNPNSFPLIESETCWREKLDLAAVRDHPLLAQMYDFWKSICPETGLPAESELDPLTLPRGCLPSLILIEVHRDPIRFRYRLTGTKIDRVQNSNLSGTWIEDQEPQALRDMLNEDMTGMLEDRQPQYVHVRFKNVTGHLRDVLALRLPLGKIGGGQEVTRILTILEFQDE